MQSQHQKESLTQRLRKTYRPIRTSSCRAGPHSPHCILQWLGAGWRAPQCMETFISLHWVKLQSVCNGYSDLTQQNHQSCPFLGIIHPITPYAGTPLTIPQPPHTPALPTAAHLICHVLLSNPSSWCCLLSSATLQHICNTQDQHSSHCAGAS